MNCFIKNNKVVKIDLTNPNVELKENFNIETCHYDNNLVRTISLDSDIDSIDTNSTYLTNSSYSSYSSNSTNLTNSTNSTNSSYSTNSTNSTNSLYSNDNNYEIVQYNHNHQTNPNNYTNSYKYYNKKVELLFQNGWPNNQEAEEKQYTHAMLSKESVEYKNKIQLMVNTLSL